MESCWKEYFAPHIWKRGQEYYQEGLVELKSSAGNIHTATVFGNFAYQVKIEIDGEDVVDMSCTCPYAESGEACKHMAAVLMEIEALADQTSSASPLTAKELAALIPEDALRSAFAELMKKDPVLYRRFLMQYGSQPPGEIDLAEDLRAEVEMIFDQYEDRHGCISYHDAYNFACDVAEVIENRVISLAHSDSRLAAIRLGWEIVAWYFDCEVDDSDGGSFFVSAAMERLCREVLWGCSVPEKREIFWEIAAQHTVQKNNSITQTVAYELINSPIWGDELKDDVAQFLDQQISRLRAMPEISEWHFEQTVMHRLDTLSSPEERRRFMDENLDVPNIRISRAELYFEQNDSENAIRLLKEGREQEKKRGHRGTEDEFIRLLIDAYEKTGQTQLFRAELENYVFNEWQHDLTMLLRLKAHAGQQEWETLRTRYLAQKNAAQKPELMRHEQMWDELLAYVQQSGSVHIADSYEVDLKGRYPGGMRRLYESYLTAAAERASNRKEYYHLMGYMKKLIQYPDGSEAAAKLAKQWRVLYRRRPAMLDELKKAGF